MNMYSLLLNNPKPSKSLIENSFDGHICRCTGYRSILDAMKSFAVDENPIDIEELHKLKCLENKSCSTNKKIHIINEKDEWFTPKTLDDLYDLINEFQSQNYRLISGNTSTGVYKNDGPFDLYINIQSIPDLYKVEHSNNTILVGSGITLNKLIDIFTMAASSIEGFEYLSVIATHIGKIANVSVRNMGTWAGNILIKHNHNEFPSDVFTCFETIGALLVINNPDKSTIQVLPSTFLKLDMKGRFLSAVIIPPYDKNTTLIQTYKVMPRSQNAHAYVNAGFRFTIDKDSFTVKSKPTIVFGGITSGFIHATQTEGFLYGKSLKDENAVFNAYEILNSEVNPDYDPVLATVAYRKSLSLSLFYKFILTACSNLIDDRYKSAIESVIDTRPVSQAQQSFPTSPDLFPLTQPMTKLNAYAQTSGEAAYVYDMDAPPHQLHGAFILTSVGNCTIDTIDSDFASKMPGVVRILFAKDIPGENNFAPAPSTPEPLFCEGDVLYAGQAVGLVIAETLQQALDASKSVKIFYKNKKKPILTIYDAIEAKSFHPKPCDDFIYGNAEQAITNASHSIKGVCSMGSQFHFYMEGQVALCRPTEDGFEIYSSTQWLDYVLKSATQVLGIKNSSSIEVKTKQLGGSYGGKITRANITACAAALAASAVNKPVRVCLELNDCMEMVGKRFPWHAEYNIGFDNDGKLLGIKIDYYSDAGCSPNDQAMPAMYDFSDNAYNCANWHLSATLVKTNTAANTACRSPGTFPCISIMEYIMEHVAKYLKKDVLSVRILNLYKKGQITPHGQPLPYFNVDEIIENLTTTSDYMKRCNDVVSFNKANRWKKRGISMVPIKWGGTVFLE
jgi:xanthine dehydrogenase/oxidase